MYTPFVFIAIKQNLNITNKMDMGNKVMFTIENY